MSRFIYGSQSQQTRLTVTLEVPNEMPRAVLDIGGLEASAPLKISLNGAVILEGKNTFMPDRWTVKVVPLKSGEVHVGTNTLEIENTGKGPVSAVPWFGLSFVRLRSQSDAEK